MDATCPYCKENLGHLNSVMDQLAENKGGEVIFRSKCCDQKIRAFSDHMKYFIEASESLPAPQMIGAA